MMFVSGHFYDNLSKNLTMSFMPYPNKPSLIVLYEIAKH